MRFARHHFFHLVVGGIFRRSTTLKPPVYRNAVSATTNLRLRVSNSYRCCTLFLRVEQTLRILTHRFHLSVTPAQRFLRYAALPTYDVASSAVRNARSVHRRIAVSSYPHDRVTTTP